jgi:hypothetical protein
MSRVWAGVLTVAALVLSACAAPAGPPLARITGACPLLVSVETGFYLAPDLVPVEGNFSDVNETFHVCDYKRGANPVLGMFVSEFPSRGRTPADSINSIARRNGWEPTPIAGVGEAAAFFDQEDFAVLIAVKTSGPNLRMISFNAVKSMASYQLAALGAIAMARL